MFHRGYGAHRFSEMLRAGRGKGVLYPGNVSVPGARPERGGGGPRGRGGEGPLRKAKKHSPKPDVGARHMDGKPNRGGMTNHPRQRSSEEMPRENLTMGNFGKPPGHQTFDGNPHFADEGLAEAQHHPRPEPVRLGHHGKPPEPKRHRFGDQKRTGEPTQKDRSGANHPKYMEGYPHTPTHSTQSPAAGEGRFIRSGAGTGKAGRSGPRHPRMGHNRTHSFGSRARGARVRGDMTDLAEHI